MKVHSSVGREVGLEAVAVAVEGLEVGGAADAVVDGVAGHQAPGALGEERRGSALAVLLLQGTGRRSPAAFRAARSTAPKYSSLAQFTTVLSLCR
jgi:hypothetical protein